MTFDHIMEEIEITKYLKSTTYTVGRKGYNPVNMLKTILFGFMDKGYISLRELEDECRVNIRYMYLMEYETPSYHTFGNFINEYIAESIEDIFNAINKYIIKEDSVDLNHLYIDGSKFEANAKQVLMGMEESYREIQIQIVCEDNKAVRENEHRVVL
jgi:Transposase and inactivated derivatives